ncbi:hypothetical protein [Nocardia nova]|uniref:hypothetical protein n=1 Tax=Nocardia nova TaxID=37330 RepID=UPI002739668E|nr:hypothetical protein [Nocardia nova]
MAGTVDYAAGSLRAQLHRIFSPGPGEDGIALPVHLRLHYALWLTRPEIAPMSVGIMAADVLFSARSWDEILTVPMLVASLMLAAAIQLLHVANCLADRWVDVDYKSKFSRMVRDLGVRFVARQIYATTAFIGVSALYLTWATGHPDLLPLIVLGTVLLLQYSLPPWHFKASGLWQIPFTYLMTMVFPGLVVLRLYDRGIEVAALVAILGMGLTLTGLFSINTAEDIPEDAEHDILTSVRALGLRTSLIESFTRVLVGALMVAGGTLALRGGIWSLVPYGAGVLIALGFVGSTLVRVWSADLDAAMPVLRARAKFFTAMVALVSWVTVVPAAAVFAAR